MGRITFEGNFCDIALCSDEGSSCGSNGCSQKRVWERLKAYEDTGLTPEQVMNLLALRDPEYYDHDVSGLLEED